MLTDDKWKHFFNHLIALYLKQLLSSITLYIGIKQKFTCDKIKFEKKRRKRLNYINFFAYTFTLYIYENLANAFGNVQLMSNCGYALHELNVLKLPEETDDSFLNVNVFFFHFKYSLIPAFVLYFAISFECEKANIWLWDVMFWFCLFVIFLLTRSFYLNHVTFSVEQTNEFHSHGKKKEIL